MKKTVLFIALLFVALSASAASLTTEQAGKWLDAMQSLETWGQTHHDEMDMLKNRQNKKMKSSPPDMTKTPTLVDAVDAMKGMGFYGDVSSIVGKHGFSSMEEWAQVGDKVMRAFIASSMQGQNIDAEMQQQMAMMENNPNVPEAQKEMIRKSMQQMKSMLEANSNAPTADIEAIKPLMSRFEAMRH